MYNDRFKADNCTIKIFFCGGAKCITFASGMRSLKGLTGFDSKDSRKVSMSCNEYQHVKRLFKTIIGENNYALAA